MPRHGRACLSCLSLLFVLAPACDDGSTPVERCIAVDPDVVLRAAKPEEDLQGVSLQGSTMQGASYQGSNPQGSKLQGASYQGTTFGIEALNGLRLAVVDGAAVTMRDGTLVAGTRIGAAALRDIELVGRTGELEFSVVIESVATSDGSERIAIVAGGAPACGEGLAGMFVPGHWDETGAHVLADDELTYACMDGVIAKCVSWGYAPWQVGAELHQTCTRLARADYCGDGHPWTLDGTLIDIYDTQGVQIPVHDPELSFEAAWGVNGALCVNATRYDITDGDGETVLPACFAALPRCTSLAEARELGAIIANDSAHTPIDACGS